MRYFRTCFVMALLTVALPAPSRAGLLELVSSGTEAAGATVGTTTLGSDTKFTATAIFDTSTGRTGPSGYAYTITSLTINVVGIGTFTAAPGNDVFVYLEDLKTTGSFYAAGFENSAVTNGYVNDYNSSTNSAFLASAPTPTSFSSYRNTFSAGYLISLANGAGSFSLGDITGAASSDSIITPASVPEPSSLTLMGIGSALLALAVRWRGTRAGR